MRKSLIASLFFSLLATAAQAQDAPAGFSRTIGANLYGSIPLVDTLPVVDPGIGGGVYFDYRFNQRFSLTIEAFSIVQDGTGPSGGEGSLLFFGVPTGTLKIYLLKTTSKFDPYVGLGLGLYFLSEGNVSNSSFGVGLGAQIEVGFDYYLSDSFSVGVAGTYRAVGLINKLSGTANATTYMPYTLLGKFGYHF